MKAESACSGVGGVAKWKGKAKRSLEMERHHRGSQRYIKPPSRRSDTALSRYSSNEITVSFGSFSFRQFRRYDIAYLANG